MAENLEVKPQTCARCGETSADVGVYAELPKGDYAPGDVIDMEGIEVEYVHRKCL